MTPRTSSLLLLLCGLVLFYGGEARGQAPTPIGPAAWRKPDNSIQRSIGPGGSVPVLNYQKTDGTWDWIVDDFVQVGGKQLWRSVRGNHRVWADSTGAAIYAKGNHYLGTQTVSLIKFNTSNKTWETLKASAPDSVTMAGNTVTLWNIFPGIHKRLTNNAKVFEAFTERYEFTQAARDSAATWTPWANRLLGTVTRLGVDSLNLTWRDALGVFTPDGNGRETDEWIALGSTDTAAFYVGTSHVETVDSTTSIPVRKVVVVKAGQVFLIELFDPIAANQLPPGSLWHNAVFGNQTAESGTYSIQNKIVGDNYTMGATAGTMDSITAYLTDGGGTAGDQKKYAIYLVADASFVGETNEEDPGTNGAGWHGIAASGTVNLSASTAYYIVAWADFTTSLKVFASSCSGADCGVEQSLTYGAWPDPATFVAAGFIKRTSIYCTYTETASGSIPPRRRLLMGAQQ